MKKCKRKIYVKSIEEWEWECPNKLVGSNLLQHCCLNLVVDRRLKITKFSNTDRKETIFNISEDTYNFLVNIHLFCNTLVIFRLGCGAQSSWNYPWWKTSYKNDKFFPDGVAQVVEGLSSKHKVLHSTQSTTQKNYIFQGFNYYCCH
jgi:hypothetical protein